MYRIAKSLCQHKLEDSLNAMHKLKTDACALVDGCERLEKINLINGAINRLRNDLTLLREKQSAETRFRARAKWFEHGEKCSKYFMNLNKKYRKQKVIDKIVSESVLFSGQNDVFLSRRENPYFHEGVFCSLLCLGIEKVVLDN